MKFLKVLLAVSIFINILCLTFGIRVLLIRHEQSVIFSTQPDSVTYFVGRNEVLSKLPSDSNEVIMLGTSLTQNFEWHEAFKGVNIKNRGINNDITKGVLNRLGDITKNKPAKIFIEIGINDLVRGFPIDSVFKNYKSIVQKIKSDSPSTTIYVQNVIPSKSAISSIVKFNELLRDYCQSNGLIYIDLYSHFVLNNALNPVYSCGDGIHLSGKGYLLWCSLIKDCV